MEETDWWSLTLASADLSKYFYPTEPGLWNLSIMTCIEIALGRGLSESSIDGEMVIETKNGLNLHMDMQMLDLNLGGLFL